MDLDDEYSFAFVGFYIGVKKRRMVREDTYMLSSGGSILHSPPPKPFSHKLPNCFDSRPLFMKVSYRYSVDLDKDSKNVISQL